MGFEPKIFSCLPGPASYAIFSVYFCQWGGLLALTYRLTDSGWREECQRSVMDSIDVRLQWTFIAGPADGKAKNSRSVENPNWSKLQILIYFGNFSKNMQDII